MKLVRALKQVSRLQGEIKDLKGRLASCVSVLEDNEFAEDFKTLDAQISVKIGALILLRSQIMKTNVQNNMFHIILELSELKQQIDLVRKLSIRSGTEVNDYMGAKSKYKTQLTTTQRTKLVDMIQKNIEKLTDKLDEFNATTDLVE